MHAPALLLTALAFASSPIAAPERAHAISENLLAGPARCVLRYLDAVRLAGPHPPLAARRASQDAREKDYAKAKELTAPRTLAEIDRLAVVGADHPLAPWREASRARVLEAFQLMAVRHAPRGAAVVTVSESFWRPQPGASLDQSVSEYLAARVNGEWKVVDRRPGGAFDDASIAGGYAGFFDDPPSSR